MRVRCGCLWWTLLLLAVPLLAWGRSYPSTPDLLEDVQQRFGTAFQGYVVEGCRPTAAGLTLTLSPCQAYARVTEAPETLKGFEEPTARTLTLASADAITWLVGRWHPGLSPAGWTCLPGVHYCWLPSPTPPAWPSGTVPLARVTVTAGAISLVEPVSPVSPLDLYPQDAVLYGAQYGMVCDGVTDNSAALEAAYAALGTRATTIVLPPMQASNTPCLFSRTFAITKPVTLRGQAASTPGAAGPYSVLRYTGSGTAMTIRGLAATGTRLMDFELDHAGTADYGVQIDNTSIIHLDGFSVAIPPVPFAIATIAIGVADAANPPHSIFLRHCYLRESGPRGVWIAAVNQYAVIQTSKILSHSWGNIVLGRLTIEPGGSTTARDVHILANTLENGAVDGATAIRINRAEAVWISDNHFEIAKPDTGGAPGRALLVHSSAELAAGIVITNNRFNALVGATEVITTALDTAVMTIANNFYDDASGLGTTFITNNVAARYLFVSGNRTAGGPIVTNLAGVALSNNYVTTPTARFDGFRPFRVCNSVAVVGNVGTGEDTLGTCETLSGQFWEDGRGLRIAVGGVTAANTNPKQIRLYFNAVVDPTTLIWDSGVVAADADSWFVQCDALRNSSTTMRFLCTGQVHNVGQAITRSSQVPVANFMFSRQLIVTGEATANDDIQVQLFKVEVNE